MLTVSLLPGRELQVGCTESPPINGSSSVYSSENLTFWIEVEHFREAAQALSKDELSKKACDIYNGYLEAGAAREVSCGLRWVCLFTAVPSLNTR